MIIINDIYRTIYKYYPRNLKYGSLVYRESDEYIRFSNLINNLDLRNSFLEKYYDILANIFIRYSVQGLNSEGYPCQTFSVLLHKDQDIMDDDTELLEHLGGERYDLEIHMSLLGKYYYLDCYKTTKVDTPQLLKFERVNVPEQINGYLLEAMNLFQLEGYQYISKELAKTIVPDVETETTGEGRPTNIFHCLFLDTHEVR